MNIKFKKLNKTIINCKECPRLTNFIKKISTEKRKQNINDTYWGKPVTGFGKSSSKLLILGFTNFDLKKVVVSPLWAPISQISFNS